MGISKSLNNVLRGSEQTPQMATVTKFDPLLVVIRLGHVDSFKVN